MTIARTPYDALPAGLLDELAAAGLDARAVYDAIVLAIAEDLPGEDVTSAATIPAADRGAADFAAREPGVVAGLTVAALVFHYVMGDDVKITDRIPDGSTVAPGDVVMSDGASTTEFVPAPATDGEA